MALPCLLHGLAQGMVRGPMLYCACDTFSFATVSGEYLHVVSSQSRLHTSMSEGLALGCDDQVLVVAGVFALHKMMAPSS